MQRKDVRMLKVRGCLDLREKSLGADHGGKLRFQDLDRDLSIVLLILREVHGCHAALTELALDTVPPCEGRIQAECLGCGVWHGRQTCGPSRITSMIINRRHSSLRLAGTRCLHRITLENFTS